MGHIIFEERVVVDPTKIKFIQEFPTPRNMSEVRSFMGLDGYYRRFIESSSWIANLFTSLQEKGVKFLWNQKCEHSFRLLKELITCDPILKIIDLVKEYVVCTDASLEEINEFLIQYQHVIFHGS